VLRKLEEDARTKNLLLLHFSSVPLSISSISPWRESARQDTANSSFAYGDGLQLGLESCN
jgi:hypothetical protein